MLKLKKGEKEIWVIVETINEGFIVKKWFEDEEEALQYYEKLLSNSNDRINYKFGIGMITTNLKEQIKVISITKQRF